MVPLVVLALLQVASVREEAQGAGATIPQRAVFHGARGAPAPARPGDLPATVAGRTGHTAFEPTLGVQSDGTIFFQGAHPVAHPREQLVLNTIADVVRSDDGGRSWSRTSPAIAGRDAHVATSDPFLYVDRDTDRVFTVDWIASTACSQLSFSDDDGSTWRSTVLDCGGTDHQHVFTGVPKLSATAGYPNVVYYCGQAIPSALCSKSLDGGLSFAPTGGAPFAAVSDVVDCGRTTGHGVADADGTVYLPTACDVPYVAISDDEGLTWEVVAVSDRLSNGNHETAVAADGRGNVYYLWIAADRLPYLSVSDDGGTTWSQPLGIAPPGVVEASLPALAASPEGVVAAAYMASKDAPADRGDYSGATWSGYVTVSKDAEVRDPAFVSASFGSRRDPLVRGECGPRRCHVQFDFIDVVVDGDGAAWAAFVDGCDVASCVELSDTAWEFGEGIVGGVMAW